MKLVEKRTQVPALSRASERDTEGNLTNEARAEFGRAAVDLGTPDRGHNDDRTDALDTVANILHWLHHRGIDPAPVLEAASDHFHAEMPAQSLEQQALGILKEAGLDANLHYTSAGVWVAEVSSPTVPGPTVCVTDSEGATGRPYLVGVYPDSEGQAWFESLSGPCSTTSQPKSGDGFQSELSHRRLRD